MLQSLIMIQTLQEYLTESIRSISTPVMKPIPEFGLPPMVLSDGILISKTYSFYQTLVCIGIGGIAVAQNNLQTGKFEKKLGIIY